MVAIALAVAATLGQLNRQALHLLSQYLLVRSQVLHAGLRICGLSSCLLCLGLYTDHSWRFNKGMCSINDSLSTYELCQAMHQAQERTDTCST